MRALLLLVLLVTPVVAQEDQWYVDRLFRQLDGLGRGVGKLNNGLAELKYQQEKRDNLQDDRISIGENRLTNIEQALNDKNIKVAGTQAKWWEVTSWVVNFIFAALIAVLGVELRELRKKT